MAPRVRIRVALACAVAVLMVEMTAAAAASASSQVRLVNARGGSAITLVVSVGGNKAPAGSAVTFGQAGAMTSVPSGQATFTAGGRTATKNLADGASYTVVAVPKGALMVLRNGNATGGQARLRLVHAAPELGSPDVMLGGKTIAQGVKYHTASGYLTVAPGSYKLAITKPKGGATLFTSGVSLTAGSAFTVVVAGSAGNPERLIAATDDTVTPASAPHTGLGGLARGGGAPWLLALLAALVAGTAGGVTQLARSRRSRP
jgi:hypothetical protein